MPMVNLMGFLRIFLIVLLSLGSASYAYASDIVKIKNDLAIWNPNSVTWTVAANSDVDDICQIHWLYDDEIDVYIKKNRDNLYYFGIDYLGNKKQMKRLFSQGDFRAILIVNEDQINLGSERVDSKRIIAIAPMAINSIDALKESEALFLKSGDALYSFPLENAIENFDVYEKCLKDNGQFAEPAQFAEAPDVSELTPVVSEAASNERVSPAPVSAAPPAARVSEPVVDTAVTSKSASVIPVSSAPIDAAGVDLLFGNAVEQAAPADAVVADSSSPQAATKIEPSFKAPDDSFDNRVSKPVSEAEPIAASTDLMMAEEPKVSKMSGEAPAVMSTPSKSEQEAKEEVKEAVVEVATNKQEEAKEIPDALVKELMPPDLADIEKAAPSKSKAYSKAPSEFLGDDLAYADGVGEGNKDGSSSNDPKKADACPKGKVDENITGVIENLTRKLSILEREKEALRVKMIAGQGDQSVISEIISCKTDGAAEEPLPDEGFEITRKYEVLLDDMKAEIENLKTENELLNAAVTDAPSIGDIGELPKTASLNNKINDLEVENLQLKREIDEFKKMIDVEASKPEPVKKVDVKENTELPIMDIDPFMAEQGMDIIDLDPAEVKDGASVNEGMENMLDWDSMENELLEGGDSSNQPQNADEQADSQN